MKTLTLIFALIVSVTGALADQFIAIFGPEDQELYLAKDNIEAVRLADGCVELYTKSTVVYFRPKQEIEGLDYAKAIRSAILASLSKAEIKTTPEQQKNIIKKILDKDAPLHERQFNLALFINTGDLRAEWVGVFHPATDSK